MSKHIKPIGSLTINYREISIAQSGAQSLVFPLADISSLRIIRNATHHQERNTSYPPDSHNNWISFMHGKREYKVEFGITSREENEHFEAIVHELRDSLAEFYYASI